MMQRMAWSRRTSCWPRLSMRNRNGPLERAGRSATKLAGAMGYRAPLPFLLPMRMGVQKKTARRPNGHTPREWNCGIMAS